MPDAPVDLSKLPAGYRIVQESSIQWNLVAVVGNAYRSSDGSGRWGVVCLQDASKNSSHDTMEEAIAALSALGLSPAPTPNLDAQLAAMSDEARASFAEKWLNQNALAARTFTEAEVRRACLYSIAETAKGLLGVDYSRASDFEELNESVITAALAAAKESKP